MTISVPTYIIERKEIVNAQVNEWIEKRIIQPSDYASPVVLVQKKIDYVSIIKR